MFAPLGADRSSSTKVSNASNSFNSAMQSAKAESNSAQATGKTQAGAGVNTSGSGAQGMQAVMETLDQLKGLLQQLSQLLQKMKAGTSSGGSVSSNGQISSVGGKNSALGGEHGPSEKIPDPTQHVRQIQLGGKTMTIGGDGTSSKAEVDAAASEMKRMYDVSPTFRNSVDQADAQNLTTTVGKRDDNTSWGGGSRVFLNTNNITAGNNDTFQAIVGHEFAHAANGLEHGAELDAIQDAVAAEA